MNPPPQENQPGEAAKDLDRSEPQATYRTPPNVSDGVQRYTVQIGHDQMAERHSRVMVLFSDYSAERQARILAGHAITIGDEALAAERAKRLDAERELKIANAKNRSSLANNLCSDHRDKQQGKPCLACEIETLARELLALRGGEGRKVSAEAWKWLSFRHEEYSNAAQAIREGSDDYEDEADQYDLLAGYARELLCVLSEEGGRQKEGQGDAAGRPVDDASDLNPQNKSDL